MFKNLFNFGYERTAKQAFGLYLVYLGLFLVLGTIISIVVVVVLVGVNAGPSSLSSNATVVADLIACIFVLLLSFLILKEKKILNNIGYILVLLLSGVLGFLGGILIGLIPVAYLSTRKSNAAGAEISMPTSEPMK